MEFTKGRPTYWRPFDGGELLVAYDEGPGNLREARLPSGLLLNYEYDDRRRLVAVNCGTPYRIAYTYDSQGRLTELKHLPLAKGP